MKLQKFFGALSLSADIRRLLVTGLAALAIVTPSLTASAAATAPPAPGKGITVTVDSSATKAVIGAVINPALTMAEALRIAALPGNQGLIRKARSYGRPGTDALFAEALVAAARRDDAAADPGKFYFGRVRDHVAQIQATLAKLEDPATRLLAGVNARIAAFTPAGLGGHVNGYLIVGGTSGGFAFGEPEFFLNLDKFSSAALAATIMQHELFHAVQGIARTAQPVSAASTACLAKIPQSAELTLLFESLENEGSASLVGDVAGMPGGIDAASDEEGKKARRSVNMVGRSITLLELSAHGLRTGAQVSYDKIYELGFYGDEVLYALGYVMARAIADEEGKGALAGLTGRPGALFVQRYRSLKSYGKSDTVPALYPATLQSADQLAACVAGSTN